MQVKFPLLIALTDAILLLRRFLRHRGENVGKFIREFLVGFMLGLLLIGIAAMAVIICYFDIFSKG